MPAGLAHKPRSPTIGTDYQIALDVIRNGRINGRTGMILLGALVVFVAWRVFTPGVTGAERIMAAIEEDLVDDFRQELYTGDGSERGGDSGLTFSNAQRLADVSVAFENVSMAAPIFSWSANEDVEVRFDYQLTAQGTVERSGRREHRRVTRGGASNVWPSAAVHYYLNYLF